VNHKFACAALPQERWSRVELRVVEQTQVRRGADALMLIADIE
jgi:hypothetical protein